MLAIPTLLEELLAAGRWPRNAAEANAQHLRPLVAAERVRLLAPEEDTIYLLPPPFQSVREKSNSNPYWYSPLCDPGGIDFDLALDIAGDIASSFADGVIWVDLSVLADPALLANAVADALELVPTLERPAMTALTQHLQSRQALLLLDNCEHVLSETA